MLLHIQRFAAGILLVLVISGSAAAGDVVRIGDVEIDTPWARASIGTSRPAVAYLTIRNAGDQPDRLLAVESPKAGHAMLHDSVVEDGVMKMTPLEAADIPSQSEFALEPGGAHIMLMDLQQPLVEGEQLSLTLVFERAGPIEIIAQIGGLAAKEPPN